MMFTQGSFYFSKLDSEAPDFYLVVVSPQELNRAVCQVAASVSSAVKPGAGNGTERIRDETRGGKVGAVQIASRHAFMPNVDFTSNADRDRLQVWIKNVDFLAGNGPANRDSLSCVDQRSRCRRGDLARPIEIPQQQAGKECKAAVYQVSWQLFSTHKYPADHVTRDGGIRFKSIQHSFPHGWHRAEPYVSLGL